MSKFEVGDTVRCLRHDSEYSLHVGDLFTVTAVSYHWIGISGITASYGYEKTNFNEDFFELVKSKPLFKVGDTVKCRTEGHLKTCAGVIEAVIDNTKSSKMVKVNGQWHFMHELRFNPLPQANADRKVGSILFNAAETTETSSSGASKGTKPLRYDLIPVEALAEVAFIYHKGAEKYGAHNFEKGYEYSKSIAALQRHLEKFKSGLNFDDEFDGEVKPHHLAAVVFHALALMQFQAKKVGTDDRQ